MGIFRSLSTKLHLIKGEPADEPPPPNIRTIKIRHKLDPPVPVDVDLNGTIKEFKSVVRKTLGIPEEEQRLYQRGTHYPPCECCKFYHDDKSLAHCDVREGDTVMIIRHLNVEENEYSLTETVTVKTLTSRTASIVMDPRMLVLEFKDLVFDKFFMGESGKLEGEKLKIVFQNKELLNGDQLLAHGIKEGDTLYVLWILIGHKGPNAVDRGED